MGGAVRDHLLNVPIYDWDIEVFNLSPDILKATLDQAGKVNSVGKSFGIYLLKTPNSNVPFEFATPRRENKVGQGHKGFIAELDPTMTTEEASARRDFTINSMMMDLHTGELIDHHHGEADLHSQILRATSEAYKEDPLRVLRGMQFISRFGLRPTTETVLWSREMLFEAHTLSKERLWGEWYKWASRGYWLSQGLEFLWTTGWLSTYTNLALLSFITQDPDWHPEGNAWEHTKIVVDTANDISNIMGMSFEKRIILIFAALLHDIGKATTTEISERSNRIIHPAHETIGVEYATDFLNTIGAPGDIITGVLPLIREHMFHRGRGPDNLSPRSVRRLAVRLKDTSIRDLGYLMMADRMVEFGKADPFVDAMMKVAAEVKAEDDAPEPLLKGKHLLRAKLRPGPDFGKILKKAYDAQLDGKFISEAGAIVWFEGKYKLRVD